MEDRPEIDEPDEAELQQYTQTPRTGTLEQLMFAIKMAISQVLPQSVCVDVQRQRSRKVPLGTVQVLLVVHDPRPWWKRWGA